MRVTSGSTSSIPGSATAERRGQRGRRRPPGRAALLGDPDPRHVGQSNLINAPLLSFEVSQSGYGMYVKYLMAGFLLV